MFLLRGREEAKETMGELLQVLDLVEHKGWETSSILSKEVTGLERKGRRRQPDHHFFDMI